MKSERHRRAQTHGRWAEHAVAQYLRLKGYRILARGYRAPEGEIDIVARRGRVLALVEVKARPSIETAAYAIAPRQRRRIERAALRFLSHNPRHAGCDLRFDAILVSPWHLPRHLIDAWRPDGDSGHN
ncbi:MAG: YraN family protein [Alphaproteobacteria bacterium]